MLSYRTLPPLVALTLATALTPGATGADLSVRRPERPQSSTGVRGGGAARLRALDPRVLPEETDQARQPAGMLGRDVRARLRAADDRESQAWQAIRTRADWEGYRDRRLLALRASLGEFPRPPRDLKVRVSRRLEGDGYRVENLVFESRPGVVVTANLYLPARPGRSMPGILICHSHHNPKTQGELQDMGVLWARLGCLVLVMDQLGHGERRQHPFRSAKDYPHSFRPDRQDYYFRYNIGLQLHLVGDSLIGWMVWDLMRGVDLLRARPGVDKDRIILLGAVAGGGDPAAVTAALDRRIAAAVPFNFGGPQPETPYPLPADAEKRFHYAGSGSWESTRNLRLSARDGFLPWLIVGSVAPRGLVYAHEFAWDRARDPVWRRLEKIFDLYGARDHLASVHGRGSVTGRPPESTHCNNIGPLHRQGIYPALKRWFGVPAPDSASHDRRPPEELTCLTREVLQEVRPRPVYELAAELGRERARTARGRLANLPPGQRRRRLREEWAELLGTVEPQADVKAIPADQQHVGDVIVERIRLEVEPGVVVPLLLLVPPRKTGGRLPVVTAFAQEGKQAFLKGRAENLARLLEGGAAVALPDLRGTGETRPGGGRGRQSTATALASSELMLGQTLVGSRLRDLRAVLRYLRGRSDLDPGRVALWGDSFAPVNPGDRNPAVPLDADRLPDQAEPLGGLLALFGALYEEGVVAVSARGGLVSYQSLLHSPFCYVPYDILIPGALTAGDLDDVAAALAPRPLQLLGLVDGLNRRVPAGELARTLGPVRAAYRGAAEHLGIEGDAPPRDSASRWLLGRLRKEGSRE
jgi:dienelactone hydrolase